MINKAIVDACSRKLFVYKDMSFGEWLTQMLKEHRMNAADLARETGYSPTHIGNLLKDYSPNTKSGKGRPSESAAEKIATVLRVDIDDAREAAGYTRRKEKRNEIDVGRLRVKLKRYPPDWGEIEEEITLDEDQSEEFLDDLRHSLTRLRRRQQQQLEEKSSEDKSIDLSTGRNDTKES